MSGFGVRLFMRCVDSWLWGREVLQHEVLSGFWSVEWDGGVRVFGVCVECSRLGAQCGCWCTKCLDGVGVARQ